MIAPASVPPDNLRMLTRRVARTAPALLLLLLACEAHAWSGPLHRSIVEGAWRVSPAAAARVPEAYRDAVLKACAGTDATERLADPATEAEQLLRALRARPQGKFTYNDALALGRLLHDVANAAVPPDTRPTGPSPEELFSGREIAVFRDPAPRAASLAEALRAARRDGSFPESREEGLGGRYRAAVQATVDALLRLAPIAEPAVDTGVDVYIVADRVDNGKTGARETGRDEKSWVETDTWGDDWLVTETTVHFDMSQAGKGTFLRKSYETPGVKILEWTTRASGPTARHRLLLLNNTGTSFARLRVTDEGTPTEVPVALVPRAVARIEFETAASTPRARLRIAPVPGPGAPAAGVNGPVVASRLFGVPATVTVGPRWEEAFAAPFPDAVEQRPFSSK